MKKTKKLLLCITLSLSIAYAEGLQNFEQNASEMGNAYAGAAAAATDASTGFFNPAALVLFNTRQVTYSTAVLFNNITFNGSSTWQNNRLFNTQAGSTSGNKTQYLPAFNEVIPFNRRFAVGLNVGMPFSFDSDYASNSIVRYDATDNHFYVVDITPSIAYLFTSKWSAGVGADFDYAHANFDSIVFPGSNFLENRGEDWGIGGHGGVLYQYSSATRFGLAYHSQVNFNMNGDSQLYGSVTGFSSAGLINNNLNIKLTIPDFVDFSAYHQLNRQWQLLGSVVYTDWHKLNTIHLNNVVYIINNQPVALNTQIPLDLHNSWYTAIGANYLMNSHLTLRGGIAYDQSPTTSSTSIMIPDSNKIILAAGIQYNVNKMWGFDLGYQHWFAIENSNRATLTHTVNGTINTIGQLKQNVNLVGAQITWNIGML